MARALRRLGRPAAAATGLLYASGQSPSAANYSNSFAYGERMKVKGKWRSGITRRIRKYHKKEYGMFEVIYRTEFVNKGDSDWNVYEKYHKLLVIPPGEKTTLESYKPTTDWARWSKVVRGKSGNIESVTENPQWGFPWPDMWALDLLNESGAPIQSIALLEPNPGLPGATNYVHAMRGVPLRVPVNLDDPLIRYESFSWKTESYRKLVGRTQYFTLGEQVTCVKKLRSDSDLLKIFNQKKKILDDKTVKDLTRTMPEVAVALGENTDAD